MPDFEQKDTINDGNKEIKKDSWVNAMEIWNEIFPNGQLYDIKKDTWQHYLTQYYKTEDGKSGVWARLYPGNDPSEFILVSNGGDPMALLELASKLLEKNINVIRIKGGYDPFMPGENQEMANAKLEELRKKFNR
ncbi:MAG: hypothetical protein WAW33_00330 [Minisyncoccia bacterium]